MVLQDVYCDNCGLYCTNRWCKPCQLNYLKNNFINWSENEKIDDFIQEMQLKVIYCSNTVIEWIPYNQFINIKKIGKDDNNFVTMYSAIWNNGLLYYNTESILYSFCLL